MSVKYIDNMKSSRGVHARWAELIGSYSFTITHACVTVEDCVSRCPSHLPEPTQEELDMEKDWEDDPPPHLDLEKLANKAAQLQVRPERICQIQEDAIQVNLVFNNGKVEMGWERPEEDERYQQGGDERLEAMISELHQGTKEEPGIWVHDWDWTQAAERPTTQRDHAYEGEIFYSDDERETEDVKVAYDERHLGAANEKKKPNQKRGPGPGVQEGRGRQPNDPWSPKDNNGISEGLDTGKGSEWLHLACHQKESQSTKNQRMKTHTSHRNHQSMPLQSR